MCVFVLEIYFIPLHSHTCLVQDFQLFVKVSVQTLIALTSALSILTNATWWAHGPLTSSCAHYYRAQTPHQCKEPTDFAFQLKWGWRNKGLHKRDLYFQKLCFAFTFVPFSSPIGLIVHESVTSQHVFSCKFRKGIAHACTGGTHFSCLYGIWDPRVSKRCHVSYTCSRKNFAWHKVHFWVLEQQIHNKNKFILYYISSPTENRVCCST